MVFQKKYVKELMDLMNETTKSDLPMPKLIMSLSRKFYRFSEYKTYCSFMVRNHYRLGRGYPNLVVFLKFW